MLHVSGYALLEQPSAGAAERAVELAREAGARSSIDLACADIVSPLVRAAAAGDCAADVAFATPAQAEAIGGVDDLAALPVVTDTAAGASRSDGRRRRLRGRLPGGAAAGAEPDDADEPGPRDGRRCGAAEGPVP